MTREQDEAIDMLAKTIRRAIGTRIAAIEVLVKDDRQRCEVVLSALATAISYQIAMITETAAEHRALVDQLAARLVAQRGDCLASLVRQGLRPPHVQDLPT